jgi:translation initiation factor IF-1
MKCVWRISPLPLVVLMAATACSSSGKSSFITGYIEPCVGAAPHAAGYAAGTVTALRGTEKLVRESADQLRAVLPTEVAAKAYTSGDKPFKVRLRPGDYVLVGTYDEFPATTTRLSVTVPPSTTLRRDLPNLCK